MKKKLIKALSFLKANQGIRLGEDTFLTGYLDGGDKVYGFWYDGVEYIVDNGSRGYPISNLEKGDLNYIFNLSKIYENIKAGKYKTNLVK